MFGTAPRGTLPLRRPGARAPRPLQLPIISPVGLLERVEARILVALESGPKTLGELLAFHVRYVDCRVVKAPLRDEAIASLLKAGKVRLTTIPRKVPTGMPMPGIMLAPARGGAPC